MSRLALELPQPVSPPPAAAEESHGTCYESARREWLTTAPAVYAAHVRVGGRHCVEVCADGESYCISWRAQGDGFTASRVDGVNLGDAVVRSYDDELPIDEVLARAQQALYPCAWYGCSEQPADELLSSWMVTGTPQTPAPVVGVSARDVAYRALKFPGQAATAYAAAKTVNFVYRTTSDLYTRVNRASRRIDAVNSRRSQRVHTLADARAADAADAAEDTDIIDDAILAGLKVSRAARPRLRTAKLRISTIFRTYFCQGSTATGAEEAQASPAPASDSDRVFKRFTLDAEFESAVQLDGPLGDAVVRAAMEVLAEWNQHPPGAVAHKVKAGDTARTLRVVIAGMFSAGAPSRFISYPKKAIQPGCSKLQVVAVHRIDVYSSAKLATLGLRVQDGVTLVAVTPAGAVAPSAHQPGSPAPGQPAGGLTAGSEDQPGPPAPGQLAGGLTAGSEDQPGLPTQGQAAGPAPRRRGGRPPKPTTLGRRSAMQAMDEGGVGSVAGLADGENAQDARYREFIAECFQ